LKSEDVDLEEARPGGLIGVGTKLDPSLTKADNMKGNVVGLVNELPPVFSSIDVEASFFEKIVGFKEEIKVEQPKVGDLLQISIGTATVPAILEEKKGDIMSLTLRIPVCTELGQRLAISTRVSGRWRLVGHGLVRGGKEYRQ